MKKVIESIELLKKLAPYLEDMETEFYLNWCNQLLNNKAWKIYIKETWNPLLKTLTLEEAIELLNKVKRKDLEGYFEEFNIKRGDVLFYVLGWWIEQMLNYLIDNNLLWKH